MHDPRDRIRSIQRNFDDIQWGSREAYQEALAPALRDLAVCLAIIHATAEYSTDDTLRAIFHRADLLLAAGRVIARAELKQRAVG